MNIPVAFGIILFTYDINGLVTEIRAEMKEPKQFNKILAIGLVIESFFYMFIGLIGIIYFYNSFLYLYI
jgi:proton-coupled amino acid transporter